MPFKDKEKGRIWGIQYRLKNKQKIIMRNKNYEARPDIIKRRKEYRLGRQEELYERNRQYHKDNREKMNERHRKWRTENKDKANAYQRDYVRNLPEEKKEIRKEKMKKWMENNKERLYKEHKEYCRINRKELNEKQNFRRKNNINVKMGCRLRILVWCALNRYTKTGKIMTAKKYGIDYGAIIDHLKPFPEDITKYHIDHIRPLASFDLTDPEQIKESFAPENHQWLLAEENCRKSSKYNGKRCLNTHTNANTIIP